MSEPTNKVSAGQVNVSEWTNEREINGQKVPMKSFTVQKRYKEGEEWKTANSYNLNDLPKLITCLQKAFDEAVLKEKE